jgi:hypothetical protein
MDVIILGSQTISQCSQENCGCSCRGTICSCLGRVINCLSTIGTPYELLINNNQKLRADAHIWEDDEKIGTWVLHPHSSLRLRYKTHTEQREILRFDKDTVLTVKFCTAPDNTNSTDNPLDVEAIENIDTFTIIATTTDRLLSNTVGFDPEMWEI